MTGANTISKMALLACWLVVLVIALLILALGAMAIALLSLGIWEVINRGLVIMIAILMAVYMAITMTLRCPRLPTALLDRIERAQTFGRTQPCTCTSMQHTCLEVIPRGAVKDIRRIANRLLAIKGVRYGQLIPATGKRWQ